uniref:Granzyme K n=1 Tax=Ursus maritimus TaxID=29073 RepID=A0A452TGS7_URSMA
MLGSTKTSVTPPNPNKVTLEMVLVPGCSPPFLLPTGVFGTRSDPSILFAFFRHEKVQFFKVILGAHSLSKNEASKQTFEIEKFIPFSRLISHRKLNDIMLIKLHTAATLDKHVQLLHPSSKNDIRAGTKCQVTGWGATDPQFLMMSDTLREVTVTVINRKLCNSPSYYNHNPIITEDMICAGDARGQKDSCQGDSGGPLVCKGAFYALVSAGRRCGDAKKPGIYTLITRKYWAWIKSQLAPSHANYGHK